MSLDWAQLLVTLGVGGAVGAAASASVSFKRVSAAVSKFRVQLNQFLKSAPAGSTELKGAFDELEASIREFGDRFARLRGLLTKK